jgi:hypothetical protein
MDWNDIINFSLFGASFWAVADWVSKKDIVSTIKEFIKALIAFLLLRVLFSFIPLPELPDNVAGIGFATPILLVTLFLIYKGFKKNRDT